MGARHLLNNAQVHSTRAFHPLQAISLIPRDSFRGYKPSPPHKPPSRGFLFAQIMPRCSHGVPLEHACHSCMQEGLARVSKSMSVEQTHELKDTITADYFVPGHEERTTTSLFKRTRKALIEREGGRCFVTNMTAEELGAPLQAHHHPVERCFATAWDWPRFAEDCKRGLWGPHAQAFDWDSFLSADPFDPYTFVDDMTVNGLLLGAGAHIGKDEGLHRLPLPVWLFTKYAVEGYQFSPDEVIHHDPEHL